MQRFIARGEKKKGVKVMHRVVLRQERTFLLKHRRDQRVRFYFLDGVVM